MLLFFFNDTATTEIYTLSLHDALPISVKEGLVVEPVLRELHERGGGETGGLVDVDRERAAVRRERDGVVARELGRGFLLDRKSTRLNSSHANISYAVFCLKKKQPILRK